MKEEIKFPYRTRKRIVLVGGHDTFVNVMKKRFPNIRFIDANKWAIDPKIIRHADVVWIQNNCMCHSQFKFVVKTASLYKIPIKYFAAAGTARSSQQIIEDDIKTG